MIEAGKNTTCSANSGELDPTGFHQNPVGSDGWLMSVFSVVAIILALPAAFLQTRLEPEITGLIALGLTVFTN